MLTFIQKSTQSIESINEGQIFFVEILILIGKRNAATKKKSDTHGTEF
jgi:hypothetical protein